MLKYFLGRTKSVLRNPRLTVAWLKFVPCLADIVVVFSLSWLQFSAGPEYRTGRREERGGTRWCNLSPDIHHCYSTKMLSIVCQILGHHHHYHWYLILSTTLTSHSLYPSHVGWSIRNKFTSNVCRLCGVLLSDIHMEIKPLLFHFSSFFACIPRLFNGNRWPSEHWSSWRYTSYLATRTREIEEK